MKESNQVFVRQKQLHKKLKVTIALSGLVVLAMVVVTTMLGEAAIGFGEVLSVVTGKVFGNTDMLTDLSGGLIAIVWDIRLPRILTGIFVGAGLAMSGTVFQALLMNPLADPYTIGISTGGAALGATIAIFVSAIIQVASVAILPAAFVGAMITLLLVLKIAGNSKTLSSSSLIVAGIIVSSIGSAAISLLKSLSGDEVSLIVFWLMGGSLASRTWQHVWVIAPVIIIGLIVFRHYGQELNLLCTGEVNARNYGVNVSRVRMILLITASLVTAACVSVSGIIGFVGLVIPPHILRQFVTTDHKYLMPLSAIIGALLLMIADNITRTLLFVEIPVGGVLTTLIGGPFFIYLFTRKGDLKGGVF